MDEPSEAIRQAARRLGFGAHVATAVVGRIYSGLVGFLLLPLMLIGGSGLLLGPDYSVPLRVAGVILLMSVPAVFLACRAVYRREEAQASRLFCFEHGVVLTRKGEPPRFHPWTETEFREETFPVGHGGAARATVVYLYTRDGKRLATVHHRDCQEAIRRLSSAVSR
ncbi:hypothetical protein HNP84_003449 [Thermocatellispora tengchongensis]|uniref:Uncharacterized protein n=1 Tax=Thermocatellispora tengchongensis TaxID=1073253 RepID=A0A840P736_9ACTN|nr:hypothetical protein [Thermocatellispora tengchongensis]MBB5133723.1 hypothetical protein [Thermocatellispora tengchongensis]